MNFTQKTQWQRRLKGPIVTYSLLGVTTLVFLLQYLLPSLNLEGRFGLYGPYIVFAQEFWRLLTPIFLHYGLMHFVLNMVILYFMGIQIEAVFGHWRFLVIYLAAGIMGNVASFGFNQAGLLSLGASTSLFGMFGAFFMIARHFKQNPGVQQLVRQFAIFIGINLVFGLFDSSVDLVGHIGGLLGGALMGSVIGLPQAAERFSKKERLAAILLFIVFVIIGLLFGFRKYYSLLGM